MNRPRSRARQTPVLRLAKVASFSPKLLPGLKLWLSAGALGLRDGDPVASWTDLSGRGNNATAAGTVPPKYRANAANGQAAVTLDGATNYFQFPNGDFQNMGNFGIYCVLSNTGAGQSNPRIFLNGTCSTSVSSFQLQGSQEFGMYFGADVSHFLSTSSAPLTASYSLIGLSYNGTSMSATKGGTVIAGPLAVAAPPAPAGPVGYIGGDGSGSAFAGGITEILVFLPALAPASDQKVTGYLKARYGLA